MDHNFIAQFNIVDRYLMNKLSEEECSRFEEHFFDCEECALQLEVARHFISDMREMAGMEEEQGTNPPQVKRFLGFNGISQLPRSVVIAACLIIALVGTLLGYWIHLLQTRLDQTTDISQEWKSRYEAKDELAVSLEEQLKEADRARNELLAKLRQGSSKAEGRNDTIISEVNPSLFLISSTERGAESNVVILPSRPSNMLIVLTLDGDLQFEYQASILDSHKQVVKRLTGLKHNPAPSSNFLPIVVNSKLFRPDDYLVVVDGRSRDGQFKFVANYPIKAVGRAPKH